MKFSILGPLEVTDDNGQRLDLGTPRQRAVLAILVLHANHVVSLDRLIDELWGDAPPSAATSTLQAYVSNLRRILEPNRAPRTPATVLVSNPPGYVLRCADDDIDAARFEALTVQGRIALERDPAAARDIFTSALALWRGPVLADFAYDTFAVADTGRLDELRDATEEDRIDALLACGEVGVAMADLERLVANEPLRERRRAQQMLALYRGGRQAAALRAYEQVRTDLADGLGIDPSPALQNLYRQILDQEGDLELPEPAERPAQALAPEPRPRPDTAPRADPFVGRADALARLTELLEPVAGSECRVALITGEAGIGKTRLAQAFAAAATERGWQVAWGRCHDDEGAPPLWPWSQSLRQLAGDDDSDGGAEELTALLRELVDPTETADDAGTARFRQFEGVTRLLEQTAATRPVLIVLDDLHWSDISSLRLLRFVVKYARADNLVLAMTSRDIADGGDRQSEALTATFAELVRQPVAARVALQRLSRADIDEFLRVSSPDVDVDVSAPVIDALHQRTGGNPFFVSELVKLLASESASTTDPTVVPTAVSDVVRRRLARLPDDTQAVLRVAAICGRVFDIDAVADACRLDFDVALDQLEPALLTGVVETGDDTTLRFSHALVSETIEADLSPVRRARLHVAVAHSLAARHASNLDAYLPDISRHLAAAGAAAAPEDVIEYSSRAAGLATRRLAFDEAVSERERVCAALERMPDAAETDRLAAQIALGVARLDSGDLAGARAMQIEMLARAQAIGDVGLLADTALAYGSLAGTQWQAFGQVSDEMVGALERVLAELPPEDSAPRARALSRLGIELYYSPTRGREGVEVARAAVEMADRLGDPALLAQTLHGFIVAAKVPDQTRALLEAARRLVALGPDAPADLLLAGRVHEVRLSLRVAEVPDFSASVATLVTETERRRDPTLRTLVAWAEATAAFFRGDLAEAEARATDAAARHERSGVWGSLEAFAIHLDLIRREQGRAAEVDDALQRMGDTRPRMRLLKAMGAEAVGDLERARSLFPDDPLAMPFDYAWLPYMSCVARVASATQHPTSKTIYEALLPFRTELAVLDGTFVCFGSIEFHLGTLAESFDAGLAAEHLAAAIAAHDAIGAIPWSVRARVALARVSAADDKAAALALLDEADALVVSTQLVKLQEEINALRVR